MKVWIVWECEDGKVTRDDYVIKNATSSVIGAYKSKALTTSCTYWSEFTRIHTIDVDVSSLIDGDYIFICIKSIDRYKCQPPTKGFVTLLDAQTHARACMKEYCEERKNEIQTY